MRHFTKHPILVLLVGAMGLLGMAMPSDAQSPWVAMPGAPEANPMPNNSPGGAPSQWVRKMISRAPGNFWVFCGRGSLRLFSSAVYRTNDGGQTWQSGQLSSGSSSGGMLGNTLDETSVLDAETAWALTHEYQPPNTIKLSRTTTGPTGFTLLNQSLPAAFHSIHFFTLTTGIALAKAGPTSTNIYRTTDGGSTWTQLVTLPSDIRTYGKAEFGTELWLVTGQGEVVHTTDSGLTWTTTPTGLGNRNLFDGMVFRNPTHGLVYEAWAPFRVARTADGGRTWTVLPTPWPASEVSSIVAVPGGTTYVGCAVNSIPPTMTSGTTYIGSIAVSGDDGDTWQTRLTDNLQYSQLAIDGNGQLWAAITHDQASRNNPGMLLRYAGTPLATRGSYAHQPQLRVYPTPTTSSVTVAGLVGPGTTARIYDGAGRLRQTEQLPGTQATLDCSSLPAGLYQLVLTAADGTIYTRKISKL